MRSAYHRPLDAPMPRAPVCLPATSSKRALDLCIGDVIATTGYIERRVTHVGPAICGVVFVDYEIGAHLPGRTAYAAGAFLSIRTATVEQAH